jgi:hypothetical protein
MLIEGVEYTTGQDRNEDKVVAHLYLGTFEDVGNPMCYRGWNRLDGFGFSIFRNLEDIKLCKVCLRRAKQKALPVEPVERKTKWL